MRIELTTGKFHEFWDNARGAETTPDEIETLVRQGRVYVSDSRGEDIRDWAETVPGWNEEADPDAWLSVTSYPLRFHPDT